MSHIVFCFWSQDNKSQLTPYLTLRWMFEKLLIIWSSMFQTSLVDFPERGQTDWAAVGWFIWSTTANWTFQEFYLAELNCKLFFFKSERVKTRTQILKRVWEMEETPEPPTTLSSYRRPVLHISPAGTNYQQLLVHFLSEACIHVSFPFLCSPPLLPLSHALSSFTLTSLPPPLLKILQLVFPPPPLVQELGMNNIRRQTGCASRIQPSQRIQLLLWY